MLSWTEYLKIWCEVNKVPFGGCDSVPLEVFEKAIPIPGLGKELGEMMAFMVGFRRIKLSSFGSRNMFLEVTQKFVPMKYMLTP
jgi:hypothetical protein